jgi:hypothetical protein
MNFDTEQKLESHVATFVASLKGRFKEHCSDAMLVGILMHRLCRVHYNTQHATRGLAFLAGDPNAAYDAAVPIFEGILEHHCRAGGNGHHVAQAFGSFMEGETLFGSQLTRQSRVEIVDATAACSPAEAEALKSVQITSLRNQQG